jgi:hypothetical protein
VTAEQLSDENLLDVAREVVASETISYVLPRYAIKPGERVLIVVPRDYDRRVLHALSAAIEEITERPDVLMDNTPRPWADLDGEAELQLFREFYVGRKEVERAHGFEEPQIRAFAAAGDYDVLLYGSGGSLPSPDPPPPRPRRRGLLWSPADYFASGLATFPGDLQKALDAAAWRMLVGARRVRVTDPEGTDIEWSLREGDIALSQARLGTEVCMEGHLNAVPFAVPLPSDANGTIAGTINHAGSHPHIRLTVRDSKLETIEGGGAYGEGWRGALSEFAAIHYPGHPGPGWAWLMECAIGTNPKAIRARGFTPCGARTTGERLKAGTIHFGIGAALLAPGTGASAQSLAADKRSYREFIESRGVPDGHHHLHVYFATLEVVTGSGDRTRIIDHGRLTTLDDPMVRGVAARHGDPDELLAPAWVPAIPGINVDGDYWNDYAQDPLAWIVGRSELAETQLDLA